MFIVGSRGMEYWDLEAIEYLGYISIQCGLKAMNTFMMGLEQWNIWGK